MFKPAIAGKCAVNCQAVKLKGSQSNSKQPDNPTTPITSKRSIRACSVLSTMTAPRNARFAFVVFLRIRWRILARLRFTLPVPVTLNRFLALEWVFIFGMTKMISVKKWSAKVAVRFEAQNKNPKLFV